MLKERKKLTLKKLNAVNLSVGNFALMLPFSASVEGIFSFNEKIIQPCTILLFTGFENMTF